MVLEAFTHKDGGRGHENLEMLASTYFTQIVPGSLLSIKGCYTYSVMLAFKEYDVV